MIAPADSPEEEIAERMQEVRRRGHANAYQLRVGVDRVSDWKEHVKAFPLPAVAIATVVGFWTASRLIPSPAKPSQPAPSPQTSQEQVAKTTATAGLAAFAGSIISNMVRQYARGYIDNYVRSLTHKERP